MNKATPRSGFTLITKYNYLVAGAVAVAVSVGAAVAVSAGAATVAVSAGAIAAVSTVVSSVLVSPQEAANIPNARAKVANFTNFIMFVFKS
jgi:hypothetical protein